MINFPTQSCATGKKAENRRIRTVDNVSAGPVFQTIRSNGVTFLRALNRSRQVGRGLGGCLRA